MKAALPLTLAPLRVVSLLPSATEVLVAVGGGHLLVGRSHECDYPREAVRNVPMLTAQRTVFTTPSDVDAQVRESLASGQSLYSIDERLLRELKPDVILTQSLCAVCSVDAAEVSRVAAKLDPVPVVVNLNPHSLSEVLDSIDVVGRAVRLEAQAAEAKARLEARVAAAVDAGKAKAKAKAETKAKSNSDADAGAERVNVAFIEWTDPLYVGGHWTPQLIAMAGARHSINPDVGKKSFVVTPEQLVLEDPDAIVVCPCGLDLEKTEEMVRLLEQTDWWQGLRATQPGNEKVALVDGNQMFNRPGPRLVDCLEWLSDFVHDGTSARDFPWKQYRRGADGASGSGAPAVADVAEAKAKAQLDIEEAHMAAMATGARLYDDPATGFKVFTEQAALDRGYCCGRSCRHCPYGHYNVPEAERPPNSAQSIREPRLLRFRPQRKARKRAAQAAPPQKESQGQGQGEDPDRVLALFWSGGKDSYMALRKLGESATVQEHGRIVLVTTFDADTGNVPEQNVPLGDVMGQAQALGVDLLVVPLGGASANAVYAAAVRSGLAKLASELGSPLESIELVFGDLHLADIRQWREDTFSDFRCRFPLFGVSYEHLAHFLFKHLHNDGAKVFLSAVNDFGGGGGGGGGGTAAAAQQQAGAAVPAVPAVPVNPEVPQLRVGLPYTAQLCDALMEGGDSSADAFGECGEFHTVVRFSEEEEEEV